MTNIAEELTGIYLRVNGFLQLSNFVIHNTENNEKGECDIISIRLLNMKESIYFKGHPEIVSSFDYSNKVLGHEILNLKRDIYLWVEITLRERVSEPYVDDKFSDGKCRYVIERLGIQDWVNIGHISRNSFYVKPTDDKVFAKVLVSEKTPETIKNKCLWTDVGFVKKELVSWFYKYREIKGRDWYAWVNPFLQGFAKQIM